MRIRDRHLEYAAAHLQHMQKKLTLMNLQLRHVISDISDISGVTGVKIILAIVSGERDPDFLSSMRDVRCHESIQTIRAALVGNYQPEHVFALSQAMALFDVYQARIADCDKQIENSLKLLNVDRPEPQAPLWAPRTKTKQAHAPKFDMRAMLYQLTGTDLTLIHGIGPMHRALLGRRGWNRPEQMAYRIALHIVAVLVTGLQDQRRQSALLSYPKKFQSLGIAVALCSGECRAHGDGSRRVLSTPGSAHRQSQSGDGHSSQDRAFNRSGQQMSCQCIGWRLEAKRQPWSCIELSGYRVELPLAEAREVRALGKVLA